MTVASIEPNEKAIPEELSHLPVIIIGGGPVGLAAAAHLVERNVPFEVFEAGSEVGANILQWGHVRLFTPWKYLTDWASVALLEAVGWTSPAPEDLPTGAQLVEGYLRPLADVPLIASGLNLGYRVVGVTRQGVHKIETKGREISPFVVRVEDESGTQSDRLASAVVDASGTWANPNPLGAGGLKAIGEADLSGRIVYGIPDVEHDKPKYLARRTLVVGAGHSAANVILDLLDLAEAHADTSVVWAIRGQNLAGLFGGEEADALPARGRLGTRLKAAVEGGKLEVAKEFAVVSIHNDGNGQLVVDSAAGSRVVADNVIAATGQRPDLEITRELRLDIDPRLESPSMLAPLIDPNVHSCGSVPPHGYDLLSHPEPGFFVVGIKSYGRAPTFLMMTGYEQVRSIVAALAGDFEAARNLELVLPETGVCSIDSSADAAKPGSDDGDGSCCGSESAAPRGVEFNEFQANTLSIR